MPALSVSKSRGGKLIVSRSAVAYPALKADPIMARLMRVVGPVRFDSRLSGPPFEALARAIAHQQLHRTAAEHIVSRLIGLAGGGSFPLPEHLLAASDAQLRAVGFSAAKTAALRDLARKSLDGVVPGLDTLERLEDQQIIERLTAVRGIGRWTVEMMLIFQLRRPDVLPVDDFGVRNGFRLAYGLRGLPTPRALAAFGERWRPHRSAASWYLWRAVELERAGLLPVCPRPPRLALQKRKADVPSRPPARRTSRRRARASGGKPPARPGARRR